MTSAIVEFAAAKINLALAVTGRRDDGYHLIDSLVTFADVGDRLEAAPADDLTVEVSGPFAAMLGDPSDNLALKAAQALRADAFGSADGAPGARLMLDKQLPVASGIGGGSADAAATLRALNRLWGLGWATARLAEIGARLGADVPMCVHSMPLRALGIGERIEALPAFPALDLVLANPGVAVPTGQVFAGRTGAFPAPLPSPAGLRDPEAVAAYLAATGNDLQAPALSIAPAIAPILDALGAAGGCRIARMSGSGATCFGVFRDRTAAEAAAREIMAQHPDWWVAATRTAAERQD